MDISVKQFAELLNTTPQNLKVRMHRHRDSFPASYKYPGDRQLYFDSNDVEIWQEKIRAGAKNRKRRVGRPKKFI